MSITFQAVTGHTIEIITDGQARSHSIAFAQILHAALGQAIADAEALAEKEREDSRERFSLELGVDLAGERQCALEAGPFETSAAAVSFAMAVRDRPTIDVSALPRVEWHDLTAGDADDLPIAGATLNIFTNAEGTVRDIDLY